MASKCQNVPGSSLPQVSQKQNSFPKNVVASGRKWVRERGLGTAKRVEKLLLLTQAGLKAAQVARKDGTKIVSSAVTVGVGLGQVAACPLSPTGYITTAVGGHSLFAIFGENGGGAEVEGLIEESNAIIGAAKELNEQNEREVQLVQIHLKKAEQNLDKVDKHLRKIQKLVSEGDAEAQVLLSSAENKWKEAQADYKEAKAQFQDAHKKMKQAKASIEKSQRFLDDLVKLGTSTEGSAVERAERFVQKAQKLSEVIGRGKEGLDRADAALQGGMESMERAQDSSEEGAELWGRAQERVKQKQEKVSEAAQEAEQVNGELRQELGEAREHAELCQRGIQDMEEFLDELQEENARVLEAVQRDADRRTFSAAVSSGGAALALTAAGLSSGGALVGGVTAAYMVDQYGNGALNGVHEWIQGEMPEMPIMQIGGDTEDDITLQFNKRSTGIVGRIRGRVSETEGQLTVQLKTTSGEAIKCSCLVNFNGFFGDSSRLMKKTDQIELAKLIKKGVEDGSLEPTHALKQIRQLQNVLVPRGSRGSFKGSLITPRYFTLAEKACEKKLFGTGVKKS